MRVSSSLRIRTFHIKLRIRFAGLSLKCATPVTLLRPSRRFRHSLSSSLLILLNLKLLRYSIKFASRYALAKRRGCAMRELVHQLKKQQWATVKSSSFQLFILAPPLPLLPCTIPVGVFCNREYHVRTHRCKYIAGKLKEQSRYFQFVDSEFLLWVSESDSAACRCVSAGCAASRTENGRGWGRDFAGLLKSWTETHSLSRKPPRFSSRPVPRPFASLFPPSLSLSLFLTHALCISVRFYSCQSFSKITVFDSRPS